MWTPELGTALLELASGTPVTVVGRISAREWQSPGRQTKTFVEVVAESVTIEVETLGGGGESREVPSSGSRPVAEPAAPPRPTSARPASRDSVPF